MNVVNISVLLQGWRLNLWGECINFILEIQTSASATSLKNVRDAAKIGGEMSHLNNSKPVRNIMLIHFRGQQIISSIALSAN